MTTSQYLEKLDADMAHLFTHAPGYPKPTPRNPIPNPAEALRIKLYGGH